ncbi:MAG: hypothetical protein Q8M40_03700 [Legionella sp.]|nr:hypothetical protein [Legionella sp.]
MSYLIENIRLALLNPNYLDWLMKSIESQSIPMYIFKWDELNFLEQNLGEFLNQSPLPKDLLINLCKMWSENIQYKLETLKHLSLSQQVQNLDDSNEFKYIDVNDEQNTIFFYHYFFTIPTNITAIFHQYIEQNTPIQHELPNPASNEVGNIYHDNIDKIFCDPASCYSFVDLISKRNIPLNIMHQDELSYLENNIHRLIWESTLSENTLIHLTNAWKIYLLEQQNNNSLSGCHLTLSETIIDAIDNYLQNRVTNSYNVRKSIPDYNKKRKREEPEVVELSPINSNSDHLTNNVPHLRKKRKLADPKSVLLFQTHELTLLGYDQIQITKFLDKKHDSGYIELLKTHSPILTKRFSHKKVLSFPDKPKDQLESFIKYYNELIELGLTSNQIARIYKKIGVEGNLEEFTYQYRKLIKKNTKEVLLNIGCQLNGHLNLKELSDFNEVKSKLKRSSLLKFLNNDNGYLIVQAVESSYEFLTNQVGFEISQLCEIAQIKGYLNISAIINAVNCYKYIKFTPAQYMEILSEISGYMKLNIIERYAEDLHKSNCSASSLVELMNKRSIRASNSYFDNEIRQLSQAHKNPGINNRYNFFPEIFIEFNPDYEQDHNHSKNTAIGQTLNGHQ